MTQHRDRKTMIRARMAATGEPYSVAARTISAPHRPRGSSMWLNPPRHDDPHEDIIIELHPAAAAAVADALAEAAVWARRDGDEETARLLAHTADDIEAASVTPAEADAAGLSREAAWHPASIMSRLTPGAIRNAARYQSPSYVAGEAIRTAVAEAWSQGGQTAKDQVLDHAFRAIETAAAESYPGKPELDEPRSRWSGPAPAISAARAERRRRLGLAPRRPRAGEGESRD